MRIRFFLGLFLLAALVSCRVTTPGVRFPVRDGTFLLIPMADDAIRVQLLPEGAAPLEELVFTEKVPAPKYRVKKENGNTILSTERMSAEYDPRTGTISATATHCRPHP